VKRLDKIASYPGALEARSESRAPPVRKPKQTLIQTLHVWLPSSRRCRGEINTTPVVFLSHPRFPIHDFLFTIQAS